MFGGIDLWSPAHVSVGIDLLTAFLLGVVHGVTPDEHTWPITFSYAIGGYSTRRGFGAGLTFSLAFAFQRAVASELAYLGLARILMFRALDNAVYIVVGIVMAWAGLFILRRGRAFHLHLPGLRHRENPDLKHGDSGRWIHDTRPWMPAVHGFIAGWGFGAFAVIIYTVLAPAMPSVFWAWAPGAAFGLGTMVVQASAGAAFGWWAARRGLRPSVVRQVALVTASRTLKWGGGAFIVAGVLGFAFPKLAEVAFVTGLHVHNLRVIGLPLILVMFIVFGVGLSTLVFETKARSRQNFGSAERLD